jgi:hypothetical protein
LQVAWLQLKLALSPAVRVQVLPLRQSTPHEPAQLPLQVLLLMQSSEQPLVELHAVQSHAESAVHAHELAVQVQAEPGQDDLGLPQAARKRRGRSTTYRIMERFIWHLSFPDLFRAQHARYQGTAAGARAKQVRPASCAVLRRSFAL